MANSPYDTARSLTVVGPTFTPPPAATSRPRHPIATALDEVHDALNTIEDHRPAELARYADDITEARDALSAVAEKLRSAS